MGSLMERLRRKLWKRKNASQSPPQEPPAEGPSVLPNHDAEELSSHGEGESVNAASAVDLLEDLRIDYEEADDNELDDGTTVVVEIPVADADSGEQPTTNYAETIAFEPPQTRMGATPYSASIPIDDTVGVTNLEAGDSLKRSYLSIIPSAIQIVDAKTSLFVWHANFHPAINRRFSSVMVSVRFSTAPPTAQSKSRRKPNSAAGQPPSIIAYAPRKSYGATSTEQKSISWGLELPVSVPAGPVSLGVTPSGQRETSKEVQHAFTISGSSRGAPSKHTCVWTVEENSSTERGIPSELQLAVLVQHSGTVMMEVDISGWTAGGYLPSHHLRPKTAAMGRKKLVDPEKFKDVLTGIDLGDGDKVRAARDLLDKWTGRVEGAVLEFDQAVARA